MASLKFLVVFVLIGGISCQSINDIDIEEGLKGLESAVPELGNFNKSRLPNVEDVEKLLRDKCEKNGAPDVVDQLKEEQENAKQCVESYVNVTEVQAELEEAKKTGSMDEVFAKYCNRWQNMTGCFENARTIGRQCMSEAEETSFNRSLVILEDLQEFLCIKDGDRLAMFVAEGGVECVNERKDEVQRCFNDTLGYRLPNPDDISITSLPMLVFTEKDCEDFDKVRRCINSQLEKCKESTPANVIDALFKFLKKQMPCVGTTETILQTKSAERVSSSSTTFTMSSSVLISTILSLKFFGSFR